jgi:hypothetical protein
MDSNVYHTIEDIASLKNTNLMDQTEWNKIPEFFPDVWESCIKRALKKVPM